MPITIKQLAEDDVNFYPLTHATGVVFADGTYLSNKTFGETNVIETVKVNGSAQTVTNKAVDITVPTKTSDLTNDSGFVTSAVSGVKGNSESTYRTGNVNLTAANIGAATSSHTHGNITNAGALQTTDITIASGDKLVVTDSSNSNKVARTSVSFDGSTTTTALTPKGTFETFLKTAPVTSVNGNTGAVTISVPTKVSDLTNDSGFTSNVGTITGITMNGSSKGTSGVVNLGTVITAHQDISGKEDTSNKVTSISSSSTDTQYPSAKCVYDAIQSNSSEWQLIQSGTLSSAVQLIGYDVPNLKHVMMYVKFGYNQSGSQTGYCSVSDSNQSILLTKGFSSAGTDGGEIILCSFHVASGFLIPGWGLTTTTSNYNVLRPFLPNVTNDGFKAPVAFPNNTIGHVSIVTYSSDGLASGTEYYIWGY